MMILSFGACLFHRIKVSIVAVASLLGSMLRASENLGPLPINRDNNVITVDSHARFADSIRLSDGIYLSQVYRSEQSDSVDASIIEYINERVLLLDPVQPIGNLVSFSPVLSGDVGPNNNQLCTEIHFLFSLSKPESQKINAAQESRRVLFVLNNSIVSLSSIRAEVTDQLLIVVGVESNPFFSRYYFTANDNPDIKTFSLKNIYEDFGNWGLAECPSPAVDESSKDHSSTIDQSRVP